MKKNCLQCNRIFLKQPSDSKGYWNIKKFCSISCSTKWQCKNLIHPMKGKHHTEEAKKLNSVKHIGLYEGEKSYLWKGGITSINHLIRNSWKYRKWRREVFKRDDYTCQKCNQRGGDLNADHIQQFAFYPELRFKLNNGRTLCVSCHRKTETYSNKKLTFGF